MSLRDLDPDLSLLQLYMTLIAVALFIIPACIIAVCYGIIIHIIWSKSQLLAAPPKKTYKSKANGESCRLRVHRARFYVI